MCVSVSVCAYVSLSRQKMDPKKLKKAEKRRRGRSKPKIDVREQKNYQIFSRNLFLYSLNSQLRSMKTSPITLATGLSMVTNWRDSIG